MLERLQVKNFRGLRDLEIEGLARINLIGGRNNSGKTSLLEAVLLLSAAGNPRAVLDTNLIRGLDLVDSSSDAVQWLGLFNRMDERAGMEMAVSHTSLGEGILNIEAEWPAWIGSPKPRSLIDSSSQGRLVPTLALRYGQPGKSGDQPGVSMMWEHARMERSEEYPAFDAAIRLSRTPTDQGALANRLGDLARARRKHLLIEALRVIEPRLESIEVLPERDGPMIWCDIGLPELVALPMIGEGMINLTEIVLLIAYAPGGVVLVDEVENGFHHSVLPDVWKVIEKGAADADTQVFATTHSYECFEAAQQSLTPDEFRYHRLDAVDGEVRAVTYDPETAAAAVKHYMEVR